MIVFSSRRFLWGILFFLVVSGCFQFSQQDENSVSSEMVSSPKKSSAFEYNLNEFLPSVPDTIPPGQDSTQQQSNKQTSIVNQISDSSAQKKQQLISKTDSTQLKPDSLSFAKTKPDSIVAPAVKDSLWSSQDSSARLEQFKYERSPRYVSLPVSDYKYSMFLSDPRSSKKEVSVDSTLTKVIITDKLGDLDLRPPVAMDYNQYVQARYSQNIRNNFQDLISQKETVKKSDAIEELLSKISNVDIYVPGGGGALFRTIFGPPKINIRVNGAIDIKLGWANESNSNANTGINGTGTQNDPLFDQQFQMNVQGKVGDKLDIYADWSTERTFEYENNLRLTYTGYEDEIIQKIEAGNVSLSIPNASYINGSSALFGIKTKMQLGPLGWTFLVSQKKGKTETKTISGGSQEISFNKKASEYDADRHFFIGGFFHNRFESTFEIPGRITTTGLDIQNIEVWKFAATGSPDVRKAVALTNLGEDPSSEDDIFNFPPDPKYNDQFYGTGTIEKLRNGDSIDVNIPTNEILDGVYSKLIPDKDYTVDLVRGIIHVSTTLENSALAVSYQYINNSTGELITIGDPSSLFSADNSSSKRLVLKLIRPKNPGPSSKYMWELMLKNIYKLDVSDITKEGLALDIQYEKENQLLQNPGEFSNNLLKVMKFDQLDANAAIQSDNQFDFLPGITVDASRGEIMFPKLKPFDTLIREDLEAKGAADTVKNTYIFSELYAKTKSEIQSSSSAQLKDKYRIVGKVRGSSSDRYQLGFNITEGSVKVTANGGIQLQEGSDYVVDYQLGSIQIRNREYLRSGSGLSISYESNELFTLASKTYIGSRFDYDINDKARLGLTWMRYAEKPLTDKVRVGDEAQQNNIWGFDGSYETPSRFLTKMTNWIPGIETSAESNFSIKGEFAQFIPGHPTELNTNLDPNGVAYIDDFEGSRRSVPIGFGSSWSLSSPPNDLPLLPNNLNSADRSFYRADLKYYVDQARKIPVKEIWPERSVSSRDNTVSTFSLEYYPKIRGQFNYSTDLFNKVYNSNGETWGGIQKTMPSYITNLVDEHIDFIEFWFKIVDGNGTTYSSNSGELYIDLGSISEDIIPNGKLNSEKGLSAGTDSTKFGKVPLNPNSPVFISKTEDLGLDGLSNSDEKKFYSEFLTSVENSNIPENEKNRILNDPSGDNFSYSNGTYDYSFYNGSEGNTEATNPERNYEDSEDMNRSGSLDQTNAYFRYKLNLATSALSEDSVKAGKNFLVTSNNGWYQVRIPLTEWSEKVGDIKDLTGAEFIRLFMTGFQNPVYLQFATFDFVGNQWLKSETDSVVSISVINVEENPAEYNSPPDVVRETDRTRPDENIQLNEQSLLLKVEGLKDGEERSIYKNIISGTGGTLDISNYETLKMFVHAEAGKSDFFENMLSYTDTSNYSAEVFLRFGSDKNSYYEISQPIHPDNPKGGAFASWNPENQFNIDLAKLTALKNLRTSPTGDFVVYNPEGYPIGTKITLKGTPTLTGVKIVSIGVRNPRMKGITSTLAFNVWANELRVSGFKEESGWAAKVSSGIKLADFANISFNTERRTAEFRAVTEKPSLNKSTSTLWGVSTSAALGKFISDGTEWNIPFAFSHSEQISEPKYKPGSDILLSEAAKNDSLGDKLIDNNRTLTVTNTFGMSGIKKISQSKSPFLQYTIDKLSLDYSYSVTNSRNPQTEWSNSWQWASSVDYKYSFTKDLFVQPFYYPMQLFKLDFLWLDKMMEEKTVKDWESTKLYLKPDGVNWDVDFRRSRSQNKQRNADSASVASTNFTSSRSFGLQYAVTDNFSFTGSGKFESTLDALLKDENNIETPESEVYREFFRKLAVFDFGTNKSYNQTAGFSYKVPILLWANLNTQYNVQYSWSNSQPSKNLGKDVGWSSSFSLSSTIKLPEIVGNTFKDRIIDTKQKDTLSFKQRIISDMNSLANSITALENITIRFTQSNVYQTNGVDGGTGFFNFFPFNAVGSNENAGPDLAFQLGFARNPGRRLIFDSDVKLQASERSSQTNGLDFSTSFKPSQNINVDLKWKVAWNNTRDNSIVSSSRGDSVFNVKESGGYSRSFISMFGDFKAIQKALPLDSGGNYDFGNNSVVGGFRDGLELFNFSKRVKNALTIKNLTSFSPEFQDLIPLPNWTVTWSGIEKFPLWSKLVNSANISHAYSGEYSTTYNVRPDAGRKYKNTFNPTGDSLIIPTREYASPRVTERFSPLVGLSMNWKSGLTTRFNVNYSKNISLSTVNLQVTTNRSTEYSGTISYLLSGNTLKLPSFISTSGTLKSDLDFSLNASFALDETVIEGLSSVSNVAIPPTGQSRITFEPRASYSISSRVNATGFFKYTKTQPLSETKTTPTISRWEAGVNIHITIQ